jgi:hypothetical protein
MGKKNQYEGGVTREGKRWAPVHYCCPGHTPRWRGRLRAGRLRMQRKEALMRDIKDVN